MLKTMQIIRAMTLSGCSKSDIFNELASISDNYHSDLFELSNNQCDQIAKIFNDDDKLNSAFKVAEME